jgi:hypothetical protein
MVDFQTLTLFSLTLLTAAMFIFYYLLMIRGRRTPPVYRKIPQTSAESPASVSQTKIEEPTLNPIQIPIQVPTQTPTQAPIEMKAQIESPIQTQSQVFSQPPVQAVYQNSVPTPPDNALNMSAATSTLSGEAAAKALKEFAEEIEKGRDPSGEKTRDASLVKLARVLIDVIQADRVPEKPSEPPSQSKLDVQRGEENTVTVAEPPRKHAQSRKKKKPKMHKQSRTRTASRKAKNKKKKVQGKRKEPRRRAKRSSKQSRVTSLRGERARKKRRTGKK